MDASSGDSYAAHLVAWRNDLQDWERRFAAWDGASAFEHPPAVPTVGRCGRTKDKDLDAQYKAAYKEQNAVRTEAHAMWKAKNGVRKSQNTKEYHAKYDSQRDWAAEEAKRMRREEQDEEEQAGAEPEKAPGAEVWQQWQENADAYDQYMRSKRAAVDTLEAAVAELRSRSPQSLASLPEPTSAELEMAESYTESSVRLPHAISPLALLTVRTQREVRATVESLISRLEKDAEYAEMAILDMVDAQQQELVSWFLRCVRRPGKYNPWSLSSRKAGAHDAHALRAEVEAMWPDFIHFEWPYDYNESIMLYLQWCVPRQLGRNPRLFQRWFVGWSSKESRDEWPAHWPNDWRHHWPEGARWPSEWWTVEQLESHFAKLALVRACSLPPLASSGSGPPGFDEWVAQGPSWLTKGTRECRFLDRFDPETHEQICDCWLTVEERISLEQQLRALHGFVQSWEPYCSHVTLSRPEITEAQLYCALGGTSEGSLFRLPHTPAAIHLGGHRNTGMCVQCFKDYLEMAIWARFDCEEKSDDDDPDNCDQIFHNNRRMEIEAISEFATLIRAVWEHNAAVTSAARNVKMKEAETRQKLLLAAKEFKARASVRAEVEAAAAAARRPRMTAANAGDWKPPDIYARNTDGLYLYLVERREYRPNINSRFGSRPLFHLFSQEEYEALPEDEKVLCQKERCTHKSRPPPCKGHCRCKGFSKQTRELDGKVMTVGVRSSCQFEEERTVERWVSLSEPILWYWQMTGDTFYGGIKDGHILYQSLDEALCFTKIHVKRYNAQVIEWQAVRNAKGKGKRKMPAMPCVPCDESDATDHSLHRCSC
jgi:hypothetical protein